MIRYEQFWVCPKCNSDTKIVPGSGGMFLTQRDKQCCLSTWDDYYINVWCLGRSEYIAKALGAEWHGPYTMPSPFVWGT